MTDVSTFFMVGPFPPPVNGFAVANAATCCLLRETGFTVQRLDTAAKEHARLLPAAWHKVQKRLRGYFILAVGLANTRPRGWLYLCLSGGKGQYADLISVLIARFVGAPIIIHHHSFGYLQQPLLSARWVVRFAGRGALHITLCQTMHDLLAKVYPTVQRGAVLSNLALGDLPSCNSTRESHLRVLGYLGNITLEKGIDRFIHLIEQLRSLNFDILGHVAGPILDSASAELLRVAVERGIVVHYGRVDGTDKQRFLGTVDVLVFPSRYVNEAEPFVVLEALAAGIPVIATARGCIPDLVDQRTGLLLDPAAAQLEPALQLLSRWITEPETFNRVRHQVVQRVNQLVDRATQQRQALLAQLQQHDASI